MESSTFCLKSFLKALTFFTGWKAVLEVNILEYTFDKSLKEPCLDVFYFICNSFDFFRNYF